MSSPLFQVPGPRWLMAPLERLFGLATLRAGYERLVTTPDPVQPFISRALDAMDLVVNVPSEDLDRIPRTGPLVVVSNHPSGLAEGLAVLSLILSVRSDVKILGTGLLAALPDLQSHFILVEIFGSRRRAATANRRPVAAARTWLRAGHVLVVFPAGEVAHRSWLHPFVVHEGKWNPAAVRLALAVNAPVLPVAFALRNGWLFQLAGFIHPRLRTALLVREFLRRRGTTIPARIGLPVTPRPAPDVAARTAAHLRRYVLALAASCRGPGGRRLLSEGRFEVRLVSGRRLAAPLADELGRLRAEAFRAVGEGGGRTCDLDRFDAFYDHLLLWDRVAGRLAGAYRLCNVKAVLAARGLDGLYTRSLFAYDDSLFAALPGAALELGRSFVSPDYQRAYRPLYLLWKGIDVLVHGRPDVRILFGAVSIPASRSAAERARMVAFLRGAAFDVRLSGLVRPLRPSPESPSAPGFGLRSLPVLVRRYLLLGGRFAAFSEDPGFGATDGLVFLDIAGGGVARLQRFLSRSGGAVSAPERGGALRPS